jgi:murein DD-endopeptidase MepM/ murein hydrolase activator NlpD
LKKNVASFTRNKTVKPFKLALCALTLSTISLHGPSACAADAILSLTTVSGVVGSNFVDSAYQAGLSPDAIRSVVNVMNGQIDMGKLRPSDKFAVLLAEEASKKGQLRVYAAKIVGNHRNAVVVRYIRDDKFYDIDGKSVSVGAGRYFALPIRVGRPTSLFSAERMHPLLKKVRPHYGIDIAAPTGTPIYAAASAVVEKTDHNAGGGNEIYLLHTKGLETRYLHLSRFAVAQGQMVQKNQIIGYVGSTGLATGPHLHWEVRVRGIAIDPVKALSLSYSEIPKAELRDFYLSANAMISRLNMSLPDTHETSDEDIDTD